GRARHRDDGEVDVGRSVVERYRLRVAEVDARQVARVAPRLRDRLALLARVTREHDLVSTLEQDVRERRPPRPRPGDEEPHVRRTKSMLTGTPSSPKRSRSSFSTQ